MSGGDNGFLQRIDKLDMLGFVPICIERVLHRKEREGGMYMATAVPQKGGCGMFSVDKCLELVAENGDASNKILTKTD